MSASESAAWPAHGVEVATRVPPLIADLTFGVPASLTSANERALGALGAIDAEATGQPLALARFMIRSESVASSKIERVTASAKDFALAIAGNKSNVSAMSMVAATAALSTMVDTAGRTGRIERADLERAHAALMADDPREAPFAGKTRDAQNWIGGSDYSPRGALYVPPAPDRVDALLDDLIAFANRDDVPTIAQATIAHAQFESIHPFGDGNGRIGRALIGAILRRRRITQSSVVPVASGLLARRDDYFDALSLYREGDLKPPHELMLRSATVAAEEGLPSVRRIKRLPTEWAERADARRGSTAAALLPAFFDSPVMSAFEIEAITGTGSPAVYAAIARLEEDGIIHEITGRKRNRVWAASDLMEELDRLDARIASRMRSR